MAMIEKRLQETIHGWTEQLLGVPLSALGGHPMPVLTPRYQPERDHPLVIISGGSGSALVATEDLCDAVRPIMPNLHADLVFSPFGTYELARATLPLGITIWGPSFYLFGDRDSVSPARDKRVVRVRGGRTCRCGLLDLLALSAERACRFRRVRRRTAGRTRVGNQPWRSGLGDWHGDAPGGPGERTRPRGRQRRSQLDTRERPHSVGDRRERSTSRRPERCGRSACGIRFHDHRWQTRAFHGAAPSPGQPHVPERPCTSLLPRMGKDKGNTSTTQIKGILPRPK